MPDNIIYWDSAFLVLAIKRCRVFWVAAGVPPPMVARPAPLLAVARQYLEERRGLAPLPFAPPEPAAAEVASNRTLLATMGMAPAAADQRAHEIAQGDATALDLCRLAFRRLTMSYTRLTIRKLYSWMLRTYADPRRKAFWSGWDACMHAIANARRRGFLDPPAADASAAGRRFLRVLAARYPARQEPRRRARLALAYAIPLSEREQELVTTRGLAPDIPDPWVRDVAREISYVTRVQRAYTIWHRALRWLTPESEQEILAWTSNHCAGTRLPSAADF